MTAGERAGATWVTSKWQGMTRICVESPPMPVILLFEGPTRNYADLYVNLCLPLFDICVYECAN